MKIIARPQCTGKTKDLLQLSLETNTPIWCLSESKRRSLLDKSMYYFGKTAEILCGGELLNSNATSVLIDDVEKMIGFLVNDYTDHPIEVAGLTITTEN
jgi:hypothetical protein